VWNASHPRQFPIFFRENCLSYPIALLFSVSPAIVYFPQG
jgi:hypothetical protein